MFSNLKRIFAFALAVAMAFAFLPAGTAQAAEYDAVRELTAADYAEADLVFDRIEAAESIHATRNATQSQITDAAVQIVMTSDSYVADSLERNGDTFSWWTDSGIRCVYSPRMEKISEDFVPENSIDEVINEPMPVKGGSPTSNQVFLIGPYYGIDSDFTDQYKTEAKRIASAIGDTDGYTLYSGKSATVDKVAQAVSYGAVVLIDTHGSTDYESGYDYVSGATSSYICLNNTSGLTSADYAVGAGYGSDGTAFINGQTIANHMTQNSPSGLVWMASCLGMATNTICNPLRNKGVEVVYGYSQSVTFIGDYVFEDAFWDAFLVDGTTVKQAITAMKNKFGNWDLSPQIATYYGYAASEGYQTISEARNDYAAFPIVVSDEDAHPGQRYRTSNWGADIVQTVNSTYTLGDPPEGPSGSQPSVPDVPAANGATLSFADIDNRIEFSGDIQVWQQNGITLTNEKAGSTTAVADYFNPVRIYASSSVTIAAKNMYKFDIDCTGLAEKYVSAWTKTFDAEGISYTNAGGVITVTLGAAVDSLTLDSMAAQARAYAITVYINETEEPTTPTTPPTTPTEPEETQPSVNDPTDPVAIVNAAYALGAGEEMDYPVTLTGKITRVKTAYNSQYNNVTVVMVVAGCEDKPITCYRLAGVGVDQIDVGDTITVTGTIVNYQHSSGDTEVEFKQGCTLDSWVAGGTEPTEPEVTEPTVPETEPTQPSEPVQSAELTLDFSDVGNRESWDASQQTWKQNGVTLVNEKGNSTSNVANYSAPARFYKNSKLIISAVGMVKIVFNCSSTAYATALANSIPAAAGVTEEISDKVVTVTFDKAVDSFTVAALSGGQVRMDSLVVSVAAQTPNEPILGDVSGDDVLNNEDVVLLMWHVLYPELYPTDIAVDYDGDGVMTNNDVVVLMWYILFPELYPL